MRSKMNKLLRIAFFFLFCVVFLFPTQAFASASPSSTSGNWPMFGYNTAHTRYNPKEKTLGISNVMNLVKDWSYTTGNWVDSSPSVVNGVVYVGSRDGNLYALNAASGTLLWSYATGNLIVSSPAVVNKVVY